MTNEPPSYAPRSRRPRPSDADAEPVGTGQVPDSEPQLQAPVVPSVPSSRRPPVRRRSIMGAQPEPEADTHTPRSVMPEAIAPARAAASKLQARVSAHSAQAEARPRPARNAPMPEVARSSLPSKLSGAAQALPRPHLPIKKLVALLVVLLIAWPVFLFVYGNAKLEHVDALSAKANTPGNTYLIVGSDKREEGVLEDGWEGERADTIMLLHLPERGHSSLVSIPRDTLVDIPGYGMAKINASYAYGGAKLLVETVENLSGMTVDHYVEVSMGGVQNLVEAVGGVTLCYDYDVDDANSTMKWTAGCHEVNGAEALAFSRMRYSDPEGDIGRQKRQRQVVKKVIGKAVSPITLVRPDRQFQLVRAAATNLTTDTESSILSLAQAGLGVRTVMGDDGLMGNPPIADLGYWYNGQSCVLLDPNTISDFWARMRDGQLTKADFSSSTD